MIYLTGDTHGESGRFNPDSMPGEFSFTEDDVLIVTGDFGYVFFDNAQERYILSELAQKPYTIAFVDGNHENFTALYTYPEEQLWGGRVHRIRPNIVHLCRGEIYEIQGHRIFAMGGAYSIDRYMRTRGYSFWEEELPTAEELDYARARLLDSGMRVDYIISHTAPGEIVYRLGICPDPHEAALGGFFDWVRDCADYKCWYFGHFHRDEQIDERHRALFYDVVKLPEATERR